MDTSWTWACYRLTRPPTAHPARPRSPARVCMCLCQVCVRRTAALASRLSAAYSTHRRLNTHTVSSVVSGGARVAHALSLTARRRPRGGLCSTARGSAHGWATSSSESAKSPPPPPPGHPWPPTQRLPPIQRAPPRVRGSAVSGGVFDAPADATDAAAAACNGLGIGRLVSRPDGASSPTSTSSSSAAAASTDGVGVDTSAAPRAAGGVIGRDAVHEASWAHDGPVGVVPPPLRLDPLANRRRSEASRHPDHTADERRHERHQDPQRDAPPTAAGGAPRGALLRGADAATLAAALPQRSSWPSQPPPPRRCCCH